MEDFIFSYDKNAIIRRFLLLNDTSFILNVKFEIKSKGNGFMNYRIPFSPILVTIKPKSNSQIFALTKTFANVGWGDYETFFTIEKYVQGISNSNGLSSPSKDSVHNKKESSLYRSYEAGLLEYNDI